MNNFYHIAYITDNNYAMPAHISIMSLIASKKTDVKYAVHIVGDNLDDKYVRNFKTLESKECKIDIIRVNSSFYESMKGKSTRPNTYISEAAMLKFNLPNLLHDVDKVLYLDDDTIINADISELFSVDLDDLYAGVVDCINEPLVKVVDGAYFNSGVMLLNLKKMRAENATQKLIDYKLNGKNYYMDQDALNVVFFGKVLLLDAVYNFFVYEFLTMEFCRFNELFFLSKYENERDCLSNVKIIHCTSQLKPWKYSLPFISERFNALYYQSLYKNDELNLKSPFPFVLNNMSEDYEKAMRKNRWKYMFPKKNVLGKRVVLYGAGEVGEVFYERMKKNNVELALWVDGNWKNMDEEKNVCAPEKILQVGYDVIVIAVYIKQIAFEIRDKLLNMGVSEEKIAYMNYDIED